MKTIEITERLGPGTETWVPHSAFHISGTRFGHPGRGASCPRRGMRARVRCRDPQVHGPASVQAIDIDARAIEKARTSFQLDGLEFGGYCESLANVRGPVDVICNFENIEHLRKTRGVPRGRKSALEQRRGHVLFVARARHHDLDRRPSREPVPHHGMVSPRVSRLTLPVLPRSRVLVQVEGLWALKRRGGGELKQAPHLPVAISGRCPWAGSWSDSSGSSSHGPRSTTWRPHPPPTTLSSPRPWWVSLAVIPPCRPHLRQ